MDRIVQVSYTKRLSKLSIALDSDIKSLNNLVLIPVMIGLPVDLPPCMRQRPFFIDGFLQVKFVVRQLAPHLGCIANANLASCMGFLTFPSPLNPGINLSCDYRLGT